VAHQKYTPAGCSKRPSSKAAASEEARRTLRYVELLSDARTMLGERCVLAHRGWGVRTETFSASCEDYFLPAEGGGAGGFFSDGAMAGAGDVEAGVDPCDFMTSMILVRSVASLVKGDFG
jgi:hypothetical protein